MPENRSLRWMMLAFAVTVVIRLAAIVFSPAAFQADPDAYRAIAVTLESSEVFGLTRQSGEAIPTAFRPPLYSWILSWLVVDGTLSFWAVACLHGLLAGITAGLVFLTTRRWLAVIQSTGGNSNTIALVASLLTAIDPILVQQSTELMTETLATALAMAIITLWSFWAMNPGSASPSRHWAIPLGIGVLLALAYLCRPTFLVWSVLLIAYAVVAADGKRQQVAALGMALMVGCTVLVWTVRNQSRLGHPVWATTHGGYTLLLANNDSFYDYLHEAKGGQAWDASDFLDEYASRYDDQPNQKVTEIEDDAWAKQQAMETIRRRPSDFVYSCLIRVARLWSPFPHQLSGRSGKAIALVSVFYVIEFIAVAITLVRLRRKLLDRRFAAAWLLALTLTAVHAVYWSNLRMRAPVIPAITILAAMSMARRIDFK